MPLHVTVSFSKKVGLPDFGSLGASCEVAFEAAGDLLSRDPGEFHRQVQFAYAACALAVTEELSRQRTVPAGNAASPRTANGHAVQAPATAPVVTPSNGRHGATHDSDAAPPATGPRASEKQLSYARRLAGQVTGLGARGLDDLAQKMFRHSMTDITGLEASGLIDVLKELKAGKLQLGHILEGSPA